MSPCFEVVSKMRKNVSLLKLELSLQLFILHKYTLGININNRYPHFVRICVILCFQQKIKLRDRSHSHDYYLHLTDEKTKAQEL